MPDMPDIPEDITALSRDQLIELEGQLIERANAIREGTDADSVAELTRIAETLPGIGERVDTLDAETQRVTDATNAVDSYQRRPAAPEPPAEPAAADPVARDTGAEVHDITDGSLADPGAGTDVVPVAAGRRSVADIAGTTPTRVPRGANPTSRWFTSFTAGAEIPGIPAASPFGSSQQLSDAIINRTQALTRSNSDAASATIAQAHIPRINQESGNFISTNDSASHASLKMLESIVAWRDDQDRRAVTADTGWCAPTETIYDLCDPYVADGMVSLPEIGITRGGIKYFPMPDLACFTDYSWEFGPDDLECMDKPCLEIPCPTAVEIEPGVIGACLTAGILQTRAFPELVDRYVRGVMTAHLMLISKRTLEQMEAGSTPVVYDDTIVGGNGFTAALLNSMEFQAEDLREDYLLAESENLSVQIPRWARAAIRADLINRQGVDLVDVDNAYIDRIFTERGLRPTWIKGWQNECVGAPGAQRAFPTTLRYLIYREGAWVRGLEPVIELESQYDSVLLRQNKYTRLFTEQAIMLANMCTMSRVVTIPVCPNGTTNPGAAVDCFSEACTTTPVVCPTNVDCSPVESIVVTPGVATIAVAGTQQLTVTATREEGGTFDATAESTYLSANPAVATVSATGLVTGVSVGGPVTITASYLVNGTPVTDTMAVTVA